MKNSIESILGYVLLSLCCAFVALMFTYGKNTVDYKTGIRTMIGGFLFGNIIAYILSTVEWSEMWKKILVAAFSMFGYKIYNTIGSNINRWLDLLVRHNIPSLKNNHKNENSNGSPD